MIQPIRGLKGIQKEVKVNNLSVIVILWPISWTVCSGSVDQYSEYSIVWATRSVASFPVGLGMRLYC